MPKPLFEKQQTTAKTAIRFQEPQVTNKLPTINVQKTVDILSTPKLTLDIRNLNEVATYGATAQNNVAKFSDEILAHVKTSSVGEVGNKLVSIVTIAKELNVSDLNETSSKIPFIGGIIDSFSKKKNKFVAKFNSLKEQIDTVVAEIDKTSASLEKRIAMLEDLYIHNMDEYKQLEVLIKDGQELAAIQRQQMLFATEEAKLNGTATDPLVAQNLVDWQNAISRFEKRLSDLGAIQMMTVHTMPEIRLIQSNNSMLIEKFKSAKSFTIPAWKKQFVLAVSLDEQKKASNFANSVDDATNEFYQANAKLLGENSIAVAKANQRSIIDLESLQVMQTTLISTFEEMKSIEAEGEKKRVEMSVAIGAMKKELYEKLVVQK